MFKARLNVSATAGTAYLFSLHTVMLDIHFFMHMKTFHLVQ